MTKDLQDKWDAIYHAVSDDRVPNEAFVLRQYDYLLPKEGYALDLACGLGGNALFLARHGMKTCAWDLSPVAITRLKIMAARSNLEIIAEIKDVANTTFPVGQFDVIVITRFLERNLVQPVVDTLKPGGLLYFQAFIKEKPSGTGPTNPRFLLADNELLKMFATLKILLYCELGMVGDVSQGFRNEALLIGQKPARA